MNKVLLDTNILLDAMLADRPGSQAAAQFLALVDSGKATGVITASSLKDLYYVARKYLDESLVRNWIRFFMKAFAVVAVDKTACAVAIDSDEPDFEDGIVRAIAELEGVQFIITRDKVAFKGSVVRSMDMETFLKLFGV